MIFQSIEYLLFFCTLLATYFWLPLLGQNLLLLAASYLFYGWVHPWYLVLIGTTTLFDWGCALGMDASATAARRKTFLIVSLGVNFAILCAFKYFGFFLENVTSVLTAIGLMPSPWVLKIALPAGISFFTFQSASYAIDVYRRQLPACRSLLEYATFASFFPQLVAGPIERAGHMLPQFRTVRRPALTTLRSGFLLVLWGLFQKLVIADSTALLANKVFSISNATFPVLWGGVLAFGVQIYADFSGYTAIARGSARMIGIDLCPNFNHPYISQSPGEFWRRWHMSLSRWFRDYVFIPLGGSRTTPGMVTRNLVFTFFLSGLWHGAGWNFIVWGLFHGVLLSAWPYLTRTIPLLTKNYGGPAGVVFRVVLTFSLMHIGRVMFREHSLAMIWHDLTLNPLATTLADWRIGASIGIEAVMYGLPLTLIYPLAEHLGWLPDADDSKMETWHWSGYQAAAAGLITLGIVVLRSTQGSDFIYFQF
jgi:D-alanyl-lipoteichoic acid acyltransferase DltB (MBOAT superfamily)